MNDYYSNLPKKRMGAGALFFDKTGKLLIVKPSYKDYWSIPGGVVDKDESPKEGCLREIREEIGLSISDIEFVSVSYSPDKDDKGESLQFMFDAGVLGDSDISKIKIDGKEIIDFRFVSIEESVKLLNQQGLARRILKDIEAIKKDRPIYIEYEKDSRSKG